MKNNILAQNFIRIESLIKKSKQDISISTHSETPMKRKISSNRFSSDFFLQTFKVYPLFSLNKSLLDIS
jgi:hypothetical protein